MTRPVTRDRPRHRRTHSCLPSSASAWNSSQRWRDLHLSPCRLGARLAGPHRNQVATSLYVIDAWGCSMERSSRSRPPSPHGQPLDFVSPPPTCSRSCTHDPGLDRRLRRLPHAPKRRAARSGYRRMVPIGALVYRHSRSSVPLALLRGSASRLVRATRSSSAQVGRDPRAVLLTRNIRIAFVLSLLSTRDLLVPLRSGREPRLARCAGAAHGAHRGGPKRRACGCSPPENRADSEARPFLTPAPAAASRRVWGGGGGGGAPTCQTRGNAPARVAAGRAPLRSRLMPATSRRDACSRRCAAGECPAQRAPSAIRRDGRHQPQPAHRAHRVVVAYSRSCQERRTAEFAFNVWRPERPPLARVIESTRGPAAREAPSCAGGQPSARTTPATQVESPSSGAVSFGAPRDNDGSRTSWCASSSGRRRCARRAREISRARGRRPCALST